MRWLLAFVLSSLFAMTASADVIAPPPDTCPLGSMAVDFCHGPPTCSARTCETAGDCNAGETCGVVQACVREHCCSGRCCGGGIPGCEPVNYRHFESLCEGGSACSTPGTSCESVSVCVPATDAGTDAGADDAGSDAGSDAGEDAGETDAGDDAGGDDAGGDDAGGDDAGDDDAGGAADTGTAADAGPESTGGGCCAVFGGRDGAGALFAVGFLFALIARRRWRR